MMTLHERTHSILRNPLRYDDSSRRYSDREDLLLHYCSVLPVRSDTPSESHLLQVRVAGTFHLDDCYLSLVHFTWRIFGYFDFDFLF